MYQRIAVPIDASPDSRYALNVAITIARRAECPIELVRVALPTVFGADLDVATMNDTAMDSLRAKAHDDLRAIASELEALGVASTSVVLEGAIPSTLSDHFNSSAPDLIVMTTHDRGRLERLLIGSVSASVMRLVHQPILLVRADASVPTLRGTLPIRHMLIPFDGSPFGEQVIPHARDLARLMNADVTVLTVMEPVLAAASVAMDPAGGAFPSLPVLDADGNMESQHQVVEQAAEPLRQHGLAVHTAALSDGNPARAIVQYAKENEIDLIAMTTHGRGALGRLVAGSTSEAVLHSTPAMMLMYRPVRSPMA